MITQQSPPDPHARQLPSVAAGGGCAGLKAIYPSFIVPAAPPLMLIKSFLLRRAMTILFNLSFGMDFFAFFITVKYYG